MFPSQPQEVMTSSLSLLLKDAQRRRRQQQDGLGQTPQRLKSCGVTGPEGRARCCKHNSPLDIYCCTDEEILCSVGASQWHQGHRIGYVGEERRRKQEELKNIQTKSNQILHLKKKKYRKLKKILEQIQEEARQTADYCEAVLVEVIHSLQKHYLLVRSLIEAQGEAAEAQVHVSMQTLEAEVKEMEERIDELDRLAQTDRDVCFLQEWTSLQRLLEEDQPQEHPLLPFQHTRTTVERLGRQLEEFCTNGFSLISDDDDGEEQQESAVGTDMELECEDSVSQSHSI